MKGAVIALICAAALAHAELNENGCPINPYVDILKPHFNCNKYYQCTQGELVERKCASDLVFDEKTQSCDWPANVDCSNRIPPTPDSSEEENQANVEDGVNSDPSEAPKICAVEGSDDVLVAHENCNQFYVCDAGTPVARVCWGSLLFNPVNNQCDWPENVNCGDRIVGGGDNGSADGGSADGGNGDGGSDNGGNSDPSEAPKICEVDGSDGVLVAHENCSQFYKCNGGIPVALYCWGNLLFNPTNNQCDWPKNVDCGNRLNEGGTGGNGDGGNGDSGNGGNNNPSEAPKICAAEGSDGVLVAHEHCNQFYKCNEGKPVALDCWGNLLFNPTNNQCDWPDAVNCGDRIIGGGNDGGDGGNGDGGNGDSGNGENSDPSEAHKICAAEGSDGVLVAHEHCNQFYKCNEGKPVALDCWGNLLFNPTNNQCDWPDAVNCGDRIIGGGNDGGDGGNGDGGNGDSGNGGNNNPSEAPKICAAEGSDGVLVAHEHCNQFYKCNEGKPVALDCWGNLLFNPINNQCDWPDAVNCGDRIIGGGNDGGDGGNGDGGNGDSGNGGNSDPSEAHKICAAEGSDGVLVAHEHCNQFYKCNEGKPVALDCWGNLLFNPTNNQCDWPDAVNCGDRIIGGGNDGGDGGNGDGGNGDGGNGDSGNEDSGNGGNSDPSEAPKICAAEGSDGVLVAHEHCNQFYKCNEGKPVALDCWGNLLFNPTNNQCDWPDAVNCGDRIIGGGNDGGDGGNGDGGNGDGGNGDSGNGGNSDPSEAPKICAAEGSDGVLVAHEHCNQFYKCNEGKPVALDCWGNLLFNPTNNQCDWPDAVNCGDRIIGGGNDGGDGGNGDSGNGGNSDPSKAEDICSVENFEDVLVAHEDCNKFYQCKGGKPVVRVCYGNLFFNPSIDACDWPDNVNCGSRN